MTKTPRQLLFWILAVTWGVGIINWFLSYELNRFGIFPRDPEHLMGIILTPFLHGSFSHLINNSIGFFILGWLISLYNQQLIRLTLFVAFWGGLLTWLLGRPSIHVGLSGVVFGYWGFATINGLFERSLKAITISFVTLFFYGGMFFGVLPLSPMVSFESHLFGALSGAMYSYLYRRGGRKR